MALLGDSDIEPIPISRISGHYLLFDITVITYLRRTYNICGVLIGSIPQVPQQNVFLGLPLELLPEEAKLLVQKNVAFIVDDAAWHKEMFSMLKGKERRKYLENLRLEGQKVQRIAENDSRKRAERGLAKQAILRTREELPLNPTETISKPNTLTKNVDEDNSTLLDTALLQSITRERHRPSAYTVTPTVSQIPSSLPQTFLLLQDPAVPASYPLFAHLNSQNYFITPGLRFGCDYSVYPGDPLRFHSHFLAVGHAWDEEIPLLDLVGGGRLGTGVKKGFLIGGEDTSKSTVGDASVRTFCIEWGGM